MTTSKGVPIGSPRSGDITLVIGSCTRRYRPLCTTAPERYDAGTTITLRAGTVEDIEAYRLDGFLNRDKTQPARIVLVEISLLEWQLGTYASGLYPYYEPDPCFLSTKDIADELLSRLHRRTAPSED